ncbi:hypothetical protein, partial [Staphylococcus epidermidis]|uniref:hypothetical protein n=1 Tax=Staphylococcus epidermidis TaxID=1282 RepID=UPI0011A86215
MELEGALCKLIEGDEILGREYVIDENEVKEGIGRDVWGDFEEVRRCVRKEEDIIESFMERFDLEEGSQMGVK